MEIVYKATPRHAEASEDEDEDENVVYAAGDLDEQALMKTSRGGAKSPGLRRVPGRLPVTFTLYLAFFGLGVVLSMMGPTLLDLSYNVGESLAKIAVVFTTRSIGYVVGSLVSGVLFDRFEANLLLAVCLPFTSIGTLVIPLWKQIQWLATSTFMVGIAMGFLDTGGNVLLLRLWGKDNGPYMQALHASFGIGALVAPLIAKQFISPAPTHNCTMVAATAASTILPVATTAVQSLTTAGVSAITRFSGPISMATVTSLAGTAAMVTAATNTSSVTAATQGTVALVRRAVASSTTAAAVTACVSDYAFTGRFKYAYYISALPVALASLFFALFAWRKRRQFSLDSATQDGEAASASGDGGAKDKTGDTRMVGARRYVFLIVLCLFFLFYVGQEVAYGAFIFSYGVRSPLLLMSSPEAAMLTAVFWGLFAAGRLLAIPLAWCKVPPGAMVTVDLLGAMLAAVLLLAFEGNRHVLWFGTGLMGLSLASVFPSAISWADQYTEINARAAIVFVLGAATGEMIMPLLLGYYFDPHRLGPRSLMVLNVVIIVGGLALFALMFSLVRGKSLGAVFMSRGSAAVSAGRRRMRKTRRERNAVLEMTKQSGGGGGGAGGRPGNGFGAPAARGNDPEASGHVWRSSDSDEVEFDARPKHAI